MIKLLKLSVWLLILGIGSAQAATQAPPPAANPTKQQQPPTQATPSQNPPPQNAAVLEISETTFDFGEVMEGGEVSHDFVVKNTGKGPLQIDQVRPG